MEEKTCAVCAEEDAWIPCDGCGSVYYCSEKCADKHWTVWNQHRHECQLYLDTKNAKKVILF